MQLFAKALAPWRIVPLETSTRDGFHPRSGLTAPQLSDAQAELE